MAQGATGPSRQPHGTRCHSRMHTRVNSLTWGSREPLPAQTSGSSTCLLVNSGTVAQSGRHPVSSRSLSRGCWPHLLVISFVKLPSPVEALTL